MKILVLPRHVARKYIPAVRHAIVSITDPYPHGEPVKFPRHWGREGLCRCSFFDFDPITHKDDIIDSVKYPDVEFGSGTILEGSMRPEHADLIVDFILQMKDKVDLFIVHCEAGVSRSPSIAMAIADTMDWPRYCIGWNDRTGNPPNQHVYHEMVLAFERAKHKLTNSGNNN